MLRHFRMITIWTDETRNLHEFKERFDGDIHIRDFKTMIQPHVQSRGTGRYRCYRHSGCGMARVTVWRSRYRYLRKLTDQILNHFCSHDYFAAGFPGMKVDVIGTGSLRSTSLIPESA